MAGASRTVWQHTLSPVKTLRYSLSFRTVPQRQRAGAPRDSSP